MLNGCLRKMRTELSDPVQYELPVGDVEVPLNEKIGSTFALKFTGKILCINCGRKTKKSFTQGYCFPCMKKLAQCDTCIMSPEKCHYHEGTCREPEWGETNCMVEHIVYLANASGPKVGITRGTQVPTRWIDQGASQAVPVLAVQTRQQSGLVEVLFKQHVADKTNWRAMLKGSPEPVDLSAMATDILGKIDSEINALQQQYGLQSVQVLEQQNAVSIEYPVEQYPEKVASINAEKTPEVSGTLQGIKGQYLILDTGVINMRKYTGYEVELND